jgi:hypothetical protein
MSLAELEAAFRERHVRTGARLVIMPMQLPEDDVRALAPHLQASGVSLSELVRHLLHSEAVSVTQEYNHAC